MTFEQIEYIPFADEDSSPQELKKVLDCLITIHDLLKEKSIDFVIAGHFSLILRNKKFYRTPNDIDIIINDHDFLNFTKVVRANFMQSEANKFSEIIFSYIRKCIKYASDDLHSCSYSEEESTLYLIQNSKSIIHKKSTGKNFLNKNPRNTDTIPQWILHDPSKKDLISFNSNKEKFKICFATNSVSKYFKTYVIFYNKDLTYKCLTNCKWISDRSIKTPFDLESEKAAFWESPELNIKDYEGCYYRILIYKSQIPVVYSHTILSKTIDCQVENNCISHIPTYPERKYDIISYENRSFKISTQEEVFTHKFNRLKDQNDIKFFSGQMSP